MVVALSCMPEDEDGDDDVVIPDTGGDSGYSWGDADTDVDADAHADTGTAPVATSIDDVEMDCTDTRFFYDVYTVGLTSGGFMDIYETGAQNPWEEYHEIDSMESGSDWDHLHLELTIVDDWGDQQSGVNSLFRCDDSMMAQMTWAVTVLDPDGDEADCVAWGDDPDFFSGCQEFDL